MRFVGFVVCSLTAYCFFLSFFFSAVFFVFLNYIFFFLSVNICFPVWTYSFASVTMCCQCTLRIYMCDCSKRYTKNTSALHEFNRSTKQKLIDSPFLSRNSSGGDYGSNSSECEASNGPQQNIPLQCVCVCAAVYIWAKSVVPLFSMWLNGFARKSSCRCRCRCRCYVFFLLVFLDFFIVRQMVCLLATLFFQ